MKVQLIKNLFLLSSLSLVVAGCGKDDGEDLGEGSEPGWCDDGADNDGDGYYDCDDNDCYNAPVCGGTGDSGDPNEDNDNDGFTPAEGDCNDNNDQVNPNAVETCNGIDDDCNKAIDDNPTDGQEYFQDSDNDNYGDKSNTIKACDEAPNGYVDNDEDCNDANALIYPGANEISWNGTDEDCDGTDFNGKKCLEDAGDYALWYMSVWGDSPSGWLVADNVNSINFGISQSWNIEDQVVIIDGTDSEVEQVSPGLYGMSLGGGVGMNWDEYQFFMSFAGTYNETCVGYLPWVDLEFEGSIEVEVSGQNVSGEATFTPSWSGVAKNDLVLQGADESKQPDGSGCNITTIDTVIGLVNQFFPQYMPFTSILGWVDSGFQETLDDIATYLEVLTEDALEYTCAP